MDKLSKEYILLFNEITEAIESLDQIRERLIQAQQKTEELFICKDEETSKRLFRIV